MFILMTKGHKPFEELGTGFAMDMAVLEVLDLIILNVLHHDYIIMVTLPHLPSRLICS